MSNKRTTNDHNNEPTTTTTNNNTNPKKLRIKEYIPTIPQEKKNNIVSIIPEEKKKSRHGIWTKPKELVLLQAYTEIWPPSWRRGTISDAWKKVLDRVNAVAPDETGLGYDACRRSVERLVNKYQQSFDQLPPDHQSKDFDGDTMKEAAFTILRLRQTDEKKGKKEKRLEFDRRIKNEFAVIENTNTADQPTTTTTTTTVVEPVAETITTENIPTQNTFNPQLIRTNPEQLSHTSLNEPNFYPSLQDPSNRDFWERHLQTQDRMCSFLKSIAESSRETVELLKVLEQRSRKDNS